MPSLILESARRARPQIVKVAVAGLLAILLVAGFYALGGLPSAPDVKTLLKSARDAMAARPSYNESGSLSVDQASYTMSLAHVDTSTRGSLVVAGARFEVLVAGGRTYVRGRDYLRQHGGQSLVDLVGARWLLTGQGQVGSLSLAIDGSALVAAATGDKGLTAVAGPVAVNGTRAWHLGSSRTDLYLSTGSLPYPVRVVIRAGPSLTGGLAAAAVDFSGFGTKLVIKAPADAANLSDPKTLPPRFAITASAEDACARASCGMTATVVNEAGTAAAPAPSVFTVSITQPDGSAIDQCHVTIPVKPLGSTQQVACEVTSPTWNAYFDSGAGYDVAARIDNPAYD